LVFYITLNYDREDLFIRDLFHPARSINQNHKSKYFFVLAFAASVADQRAQGEGIDKSELDDTMKAIQHVQPICHNNPFGSELLATIADIKAYLSYPVVSRATIYWIKINMTDPAHFPVAHTTQSITTYLDLLKEIAYTHVLLRTAIFELLVQCFEMDTREALPDTISQIQLKKTFLTNIIFLIQCGYVLPCLTQIKTWSATSDKSLIRFFLSQLLDMIEPPYSTEFLTIILQIMKQCITAESLKNSPVAVGFLNHISETDYKIGVNERRIYSELRALIAHDK